MAGKVRFTVEHRFWSKVDKSAGPNACWPWTGYRMKVAGHGQFRIHPGELILSHRMSWIITNGPIPDGMHVCHHCDHGWCCNPEHLFIGTHKDNMDDMWSKGRGFSLFAEHPDVVRGESNNKSKLTAGAVIEIRRLTALGLTQKHIAHRFGVTRQNIKHVTSRHTWRHVP